MCLHGVDRDYAPDSCTGRLYPEAREPNPFCLAFGALLSRHEIRHRLVSPIVGAPANGCFRREAVGHG